MGILFSRSIAVLEAKRKYILNLDQDDFFLDENLFDIFYEEAEEGNFDIVSFIEIEIKNYNAKITEILYSKMEVLVMLMLKFGEN